MADQIKQCSDTMSEDCLNIISGSYRGTGIRNVIKLLISLSLLLLLLLLLGDNMVIFSDVVNRRG